MVLLALAFLVTALVYASVGFGGGSTYTALLALAGVDYRLIAPVSLLCNIVVVAGATVRFARAGITPWRKAALLTAIGAPAAFAGGLTPIGEAAFLVTLGASLILAAVALMVPVGRAIDGPALPWSRWLPVLAAPIGYLAGLVGIGGGIFLAPLLYIARWDRAQAIAATASLFILVNSLFGLGGQLARAGTGRLALALDGGWPLVMAVAVGGQIGSLLALRLLSERVIRTLTGVLTLWVGLRLVLTAVA